MRVKHIGLSGRRFLVIPLLLLILSGCACLKENNRRLLNSMDSAIHPGSTGGKVALAPVMIPAGTAGLATDIALVHPACMIPKAADDVYELLWKPRDIGMFRKALLFLPIVVLTPPTFAADWLSRCLFDTD